MAGLHVELDRIINDTIHKTFGGSDLYEETLLKEFQQQQLRANQAAKTGMDLDSDRNHSIAASAGQLDNITQLLQNIEMDQYERIFWILFFSIMVLVAAGGNIIVIYIVSTNKEMKSVTNYFLVNLSLADTMVSTLNVIFNFISMLNSHWPFGKLYCKISNFIAILSISASVFTLTAISCDRYTAIIHPLRPRMSHRHAVGWILLIWTLSSALALPNAIYSTLVEDRLLSDSFATTCTMIWPDGRYPQSSYDHIYNIVVLVLTYLVPIITMAILYYKVGKELWGYEAIGENVDKQRRAIMAKKKIVKMMIVVVIIFALCWLPYHAFFVVNYYLPIFQEAPLHYQRCYLLMYWLAMSNSMYNPIIIYFMNSKFRHEFKRVLCFICCCRKYNPPPTTTRPSETTQNHNHEYANSSCYGNKQNSGANTHLKRSTREQYLVHEQNQGRHFNGRISSGVRRLKVDSATDCDTIDNGEENLTDESANKNDKKSSNGLQSSMGANRSVVESRSGRGGCSSQHGLAEAEREPFIKLTRHATRDNSTTSDLMTDGASEKLIDFASKRSNSSTGIRNHSSNSDGDTSNINNANHQLAANEDEDDTVWI